MNKYQDALNKIVKSCCPNCTTNGCKDCSIEKICNNTAKSWVDRLQELVDKATPKKPKGLSICPNCETHLYIDQQYCDKCGTKIDWSCGDE